MLIIILILIANVNGLNITISKCSCDINEVKFNDKCFPTRTSIPFLSFGTWNRRTVKTDTVYARVTSGFSCKSGYSLQSLPGYDFYVVRDGLLFHWETGAIYNKDKYCIEHVFDKRGRVKLEALACVKIPIVPRCCPQYSELTSENFECIYKPFTPFNPPIKKGSNFLKWRSVKGPFKGLPACTKSEIYYQITLEGSRATHLFYRTNGVFLQVRNTSLSRPYILAPYDYCIAVQEVGGRFIHSAIYCDKPPDKFLSQLLKKI